MEAGSIHEVIGAVAQRFGVGLGKVAQPLRVAIGRRRLSADRHYRGAAGKGKDIGTHRGRIALDAGGSLTDATWIEPI